MNAMLLAARKVDHRSRSNATVEARVTPLGLAGLTRRTQPIQIAGSQRALPDLDFFDHSRRGQQTCGIGVFP